VDDGGRPGLVYGEHEKKKAERLASSGTGTSTATAAGAGT
jgi:hypothetical protein